MITFEDFKKVDVRVGKILEAEDFPEAKNPSYKLKIDFGPEIGIKKSSAQITKLYKKDDLKGRLILAVVNFPPKQIANFISEVLVLGVPDKNHDVVLVRPDKEVDIGVNLY
jgi:tRNA-binding protein